MKLFVYVFTFMITLSLSSCNNTNDDLSAQASLNAEEINMLQYMHEEEKLARDVYKFLYDTHGHFTFNNIMQSEQRHMDRILMLLNQYDIKSSTLNDYGKFSIPELQNLYDKLTAQGQTSLVEVLKVGATIEDLDIKDLMSYSEKTKNPAILQIFDNLTCGSRNHLRAFVSNLKVNNSNYDVQFLSNELYGSIINGNHERCGMTNQQGMRQGQGRGRKGNGMEQGSGRGMRDQGRNNGNCIYQCNNK